jgi:hypothetical protein
MRVADTRAGDERGSQVWRLFERRLEDRTHPRETLRVGRGATGGHGIATRGGHAMASVAE